MDLPIRPKIAAVAAVPVPTANPVDTTQDDTADVMLVNVTPYGYTSNDLTGLKDIVGYVKAAKDASEAATNAADSVANALTNASGLSSKIDNAIAQMQQQSDYMTDLLGKINTTANTLATQVSQATAAATNAARDAAKAKASEDIVQSSALAALYSYGDHGDTGSSGATGDVIITITDGTVQRFRLLNSVTNLTISQFPGDQDDTARQITLLLDQGTGSNKIKWPANINWNDGRAPVLSNRQHFRDTVNLLTIDKGKTWNGYFTGGWMKYTDAP